MESQRTAPVTAANAHRPSDGRAGCGDRRLARDLPAPGVRNRCARRGTVHAAKRSDGGEGRQRRSRTRVWAELPLAPPPAEDTEAPAAAGQTGPDDRAIVIPDERTTWRVRVRRRRALWESRYRPSSLGASLGVCAGPAAACFLASLLACFRSRRSRTAFSRLRFAIVVLFLELEAMRVCPFSGMPSASMTRTCFILRRAADGAGWRLASAATRF